MVVLGGCFAMGYTRGGEFGKSLLKSDWLMWADVV
jgi:hypothetical protein